MANPNIVNVTSIYGKTYGDQITTAGLNYSPASTGEVAKINALYIVNVGNSSQSVNVSVGETGTPNLQFDLAYGISVPANSTLTVIDKNSAVYVNESQWIQLLSSDDTSLKYTVSYEVIA